MNKCSINDAELLVYIKRNKIVATAKGLFNESNPINQLFIASRQKKKIKEQNKNLETSSEIPYIPPEGIDDIFISEQKKKHWQALNEQKTHQKLTLDIAKRQGQVVPYELIKPIFLQHNQSILISYKNGIDTIIRIISKQRELDVNEIAQINKDLITALNDSVVNATDLSMKSIDMVIENYSQSRGVGEHS